MSAMVSTTGRILCASLLVACGTTTGGGESGTTNDQTGAAMTASTSFGTSDGGELDSDSGSGQCPADIVLEGDVTITDATDAASFACVATIAGRLTVGPTTLLADLMLLDHLTSVSGGVLIQGNAALSTLAGLEGLIQVGPDQGWSGDFALSANPALSDVQAVSNLAGNATNSAQLHVVDNDALVDLAGFTGLAHLGELNVDDNDALTSLTGLEQLEEAGSIHLNRNPLLATLSGLSGLRTVTVEFSIGYCSTDPDTGNAALTSLSGLASLESVEYLHIAENLALASLDGAESLAAGSVGQLTIAENPMLPTATAQTWADSHASEEGMICGNAAGEPCSCGESG